MLNNNKNGAMSVAAMKSKSVWKRKITHVRLFVRFLIEIQVFLRAKNAERYYK